MAQGAGRDLLRSTQAGRVDDVLAVLYCRILLVESNVLCAGTVALGAANAYFKTVGMKSEPGRRAYRHGRRGVALYAASADRSLVQHSEAFVRQILPRNDPVFIAGRERPSLFRGEVHPRQLEQSVSLPEQVGLRPLPRAYHDLKGLGECLCRVLGVHSRLKKPAPPLLHREL